jgi:hypothetical protein
MKIMLSILLASCFLGACGASSSDPSPPRDEMPTIPDVNKGANQISSNGAGCCNGDVVSKCDPSSSGKECFCHWRGTGWICS